MSRAPAGCRSRCRSGPTPARPPAGAARSGRSRGRRPCRRARRRPSATTRRAARGRGPSAGRCTTRTCGSSAASAAATSKVVSVLALSATVIRNVYGSWVDRCWCSRRTLPGRSACSLCTGTTTSSTGGRTTSYAGSSGRCARSVTSRHPTSRRHLPRRAGHRRRRCWSRSCSWLASRWSGRPSMVEQRTHLVAVELAVGELVDQTVELPDVELTQAGERVLPRLLALTRGRRLLLRPVRPDRRLTAGGGARRVGVVSARGEASRQQHSHGHDGGRDGVAPAPPRTASALGRPAARRPATRPRSGSAR